jgi:predicted ATPase
VIQDQVANSGSALPWADAPRFAELLTQRSIATYHAQAAKSTQTPVYFDRGVGDAFTCADVIGHTLPAHLHEQASICRYRNPIFLAPYWQDIYTTDTERRQTIEEAERTEHAVVKTYNDLGYEMMRLPFASPAERAGFILRYSQ